MEDAKIERNELREKKEEILFVVSICVKSGADVGGRVRIVKADLVFKKLNSKDLVGSYSCEQLLNDAFNDDAVLQACAQVAPPVQANRKYVSILHRIGVNGHALGDGFETYAETSAGQLEMRFSKLAAGDRGQHLVSTHSTDNIRILVDGYLQPPAAAAAAGAKRGRGQCSTCGGAHLTGAAHCPGKGAGGGGGGAGGGGARA